ncbi:MAG: T9SS type A sorting domain-containing protein [Flavobacteriales bacterium]|nr:T9SS type A sorting domain-containing protein [Flavobacteriales bacterium]MBK9074276.1 T9SS type A sorting domain-containing protein [Flavobacteriales bacterium]
MGTLTRYAFALGVITLSSQLLSAQQPWDWGFGHAGHIWDIATDADGYSYVVGHAYDTVGFMGVQTDPGGGFLAKVSPTGSMIWTQTFTNAIFLEIELKNDLLYATGEGETNVVVGSHSFFVDPGQGWACLVASFDTTGNDLWVNCLRSPEDISANDLDVNDAGELFIAGTGREAIYTNTDTLYLNSPWAQVLILKYAPGGSVEWITTAGCISSETFATGIACDELGAAYITGSAYDGMFVDCDSLEFGPFTMPSTSSFFLTKVDGAGDFVWLRHAFGAMATDVEYLGGNAVAVIGNFSDSTNAVGTSTLLSQTTDMFMGSFDLDGVPGWSYRSEAANDPALCGGRTLDRSPDGGLFALSSGSGSILFDGTTVNTTGHGVQVSKFAVDGTRQWTAVMEGHPDTNWFSHYGGLASDQEGRAYVAGCFNSGTPSAWLTLGTYSVTGTLNGFSLYVARTNDITEGLPEAALPDFSIYPNPTSGIIRVEGITANAQVTFTDARGRVVVPSRIAKGLFDMNGMDDGMYMIRIRDGAHDGIGRVVVMR